MRYRRIIVGARSAIPRLMEEFSKELD